MRNLFILLLLPLIMSTLSCSESVTFTEDEIKIITQSDSIGILPLYTIENPQETAVLRAVATDLNKSDIKSQYFKLLKERMLETVNDTTNPGVGLAAPQVGISKRLVLVQRFDKKGEPFEFYINAKILEYSKECELGGEGCLSVPNRHEEVMRSNKIVISYLDENSFRVKKDTVSGFTAVIFQHEIDHLEGILYIDRLSL